MQQSDALCWEAIRRWLAAAHRRAGGIACVLAMVGCLACLPSCRDRSRSGSYGQQAPPAALPRAARTLGAMRPQGTPGVIVRRAGPDGGEIVAGLRAAEGREIVAGLRAADEDARYAALDRLVKGWPRTRPVLGEALRLLREDGSTRGGVALSLARLGRPLVPDLVAMVARAPSDPKTLLGAGALAYHLVSPTGLVKRSARERAEIRAALRPLQGPLRKAFLADPRPDYEILQGVAAFGEQTLTWLLGPAGRSGLSRTAMVLYLLLSEKPEEILLDPADRGRLRRQAAPLAPLLAEALATARHGPTGERPDALVLGLSVLGAAAARALAESSAFRQPARCAVAVKALAGLAEQGGSRALGPARSLLRRCAASRQVLPAVAAQARRLLGQHGKR